MRTKRLDRLQRVIDLLLHRCPVVHAIPSRDSVNRLQLISCVEIYHRRASRHAAAPHAHAVTPRTAEV
jgi:hypothetical protein